jgi:hypothetical protein
MSLFTGFRRLEGWLRGTVVLYLLSTICLVAVHQHTGALQGHECALCVVAHTPAAVVATAPQAPLPTPNEFILPIPTAPQWDSEPVSTGRTRAPPLA